MTSPNVATLAYLHDALAKNDTWAVLSQDAAGNLTIAAEIGPGAANTTITPLVGPTGPAGTTQFPLMLQPEVLTDPSDLPTDLTKTDADVGRYWIIDVQNGETGAVTSTGAYIWFGTEFRFLPFGNQGAPGPYGVISPYVTLLPPDRVSQPVVTGTGTSGDPYIWDLELSIPEGPVGPCCPVAEMVDFVPTVPTVGQFITATDTTVEYGGHALPLWAPANVGDIVPQCYTVPQSAFTAAAGVILAAEISVVGTGAGASTLMDVTSFSWSHNAPAGADVFVFTACSSTEKPSAVTYGGAAMTALGSCVINAGAVSLWHLADVAGGSQSVVATIPETASTYITGNSIALLNVGSVGVAATANAANTLAFQSISCNARQVILQGFGFAGVPEFPYGGVIACDGSADSSTKAGLLVNWALTPTDFGTLGATANDWTGIGVVLSPVQSVATIAQFGVPANDWAWKPVVFGQIQMFEVELSLNPLQIGIEVLLGSPDPQVGTLVARGFGNTPGGVVTVVPHTSSPASPGTAMTPWNSVGLVEANHGGSAATLYVNLINDGIAAVYDYNPAGAELFVMACPATTQSSLDLTVAAALHPTITLSAYYAVNASLEFKGGGTFTASDVEYSPDPQQFRTSGTYTPPSWWVSGTDYLDLIAVGNGGGASTAGGGDAGGPGGAGSWATATIQTLSSGSLTVTIAGGGAGSSTTANGAAGTAVTIKDGATTKLTAAGGSGGTYEGGGAISGTGWYGPSPGNETFESQTYYGGEQTTTSGTPGGWPGGGGAGADGVFLAGGNGAAGSAWIVARKA